MPRVPRRRVPALLVSFALVGSIVVAPAPAVAQGPGEGGPREEGPGEGGPREEDPGELAPSPRWRAPVPGEVIKPYDPPEQDWLPGHRGVDLRAEPGDPIRAAGAGTVTHAGPVAGVGWVTIAHAGGVETTYGPVTSLRVAEGEHVASGARIGELDDGGHGVAGSDHGLHLGARLDGEPTDPTVLFEPWRPTLVGPGQWRPDDHAVEAYESWEGGRFGGWTVGDSPEAREPGYAYAPNPNHAIVLPGLATSSGQLPLELDHLGYDPASTTGFSYAGRIDQPSRAADDPWRDQRDYGPPATWSGVEDAAEHLEAHLRAQQEREPGRAVDLIGHSMGGVVAMDYLTRLHDPYDPELPPIGNVVTFAAPLRGADTAALGRDVADHSWLGPLAELARRGWAASDLPGADGADDLTLDADAIDQLRPGSPLLDGVTERWFEALRADVGAGALATGTRVLTISGSHDLVVGADDAAAPKPAAGAVDRPPVEGLGPDADWTGATVDDPRVEHRVLPGGHTGVLETEAAREVVWRFLAGEPVTESPGRLSRTVGGELGDALRVGGSVLRLHDEVAGPLRDLLRRPPGPIERP